MMKNFLDYYELYSSTDNAVEKFDKNLRNKLCRFCNQADQSKFNSIPHIIPELFGKNKITSNFECDDCNKKFQKYENDAATMIQHHLSLLGLKTKKGIPTFQSCKKQDKSSTILKAEGNQRFFNFSTNLNDFEYHEEKNKLTVRFRTRKFSPYSVYKVLFKVGISLLKENDILENKHYLELINSENPILSGIQFFTAYRYMLKTVFFKTPKALLYRAKKVLIDKTEIPEYTLVIQFGNIVIQLFLPVSKNNDDIHNKENGLVLELFPSFLYDDVNQITNIEIFQMNLAETAKVSITDEIVMYYNKKERVE
jgi:hypothetical protein